MPARADEPAQSSALSNQSNTQLNSQDVLASVEEEQDLTVRPNGGRPMSPDPPIVNVSSPSSPTSATSITSQNTEIPGALTDRALRRRSLMDPRNNRLSGFLSHLIRRDRERDPERSPGPERPSSPPVTPQETVSKIPPPPRSATPPPPLPTPTLNELGLSLSVLTANLSPSHFSTPPTNGTFLAPHYLLLCHPQGLDVLPLVRPPAPEPYAIIRRVPFKSVVVMEERGILVAIAGRRDGVRFYSLEDIRKAIEWRIDEEIRKELDRQRKEDAKYGPSGPVDNIFGPVSARSYMKSKDSLLLSEAKVRLPISSPPMPKPLPRPKTPPPRPRSPPPHYDEVVTPPRPRPRSAISSTSLTQPSLPHRASVSTVVPMPGSSRRRGSNMDEPPERPTDVREEQKTDTLEPTWDGSSDEEAISLATAGPSGSAALDERTSAIPPRVPEEPDVESDAVPAAVADPLPSTSNPPAISRPHRPSDLDLSGTRLTVPDPSHPSPMATLNTIRQTLAQTPALIARGPTIVDSEPSDVEGEDENAEDGTTPTGERISFAEALLESRLPDLPPPGTRQPQQPYLIGGPNSAVTEEDEPNSPGGRRSSASSSNRRESIQTTPKSATARSDRSRRRRWTVLDGIFNSMPPPPQSAPPDMPSGPNGTDRRQVTRTPSQSSINRSQPTRRTPTRLTRQPSNGSVPSLPTQADSRRSTSSRPSTSSSRFLPRIFTQGLHPRRSEESGLGNSYLELDITRKPGSSSTHAHAPPKFDCMKLSGIKNAIMIKAVETSKKSFLAILCGDAGEKVELYAGTYRTNLGLSRTFILPDSPRNLELQLQGDDLIEVFLVFSHNVFGLEPATVRVREIRVGRSEREAVRRRARQLRQAGQGAQEEDNQDNQEDETNVSVTVGVMEPPASTDGTGADTPPVTRPTMSRQNTTDDDPTGTPVEGAPTTSETTHDDILALTASQMGAYTTFQQLSFSPNFPLATISDDWVIPPTYPSVITQCEKPPGSTSQNENEDTAQTSSSTPSPAAVPALTVAPVPTPAPARVPQVSTPPGLPLPQSLPPSKWYYKDPKGVVQGPWKASIMQAWYKEGYLPLDLPVRRENETEYITLQELRLQAVDPNHPFRPPRISPEPNPMEATTSTVTSTNASTSTMNTKPNEPLLHPISLLAQPKHYGPPALFFSSRGGHSTSIVDNRGKSVLKGRFYWTIDDEESQGTKGKLGDIKRVEAFDVRDRAVVVALRQGGIEAVDVGDALMAPADESRTALPDFKVPASAVSRRGTYVWRIGNPVSLPAISSSRDEPQTTALTLARKKHQSNVPGKLPAKPDSTGFDDQDTRPQEEVLFLGRNEDSVYFCERNVSNFRILRLSPVPT